jgi:hypothetical protein
MFSSEHFPSSSQSSSGRSPVAVQETLKTTGAGRNPQLIATDPCSTGNSAFNPSQPQEMSSFQSTKDRFDRINSRPNNRLPNNAAVANTWRHSTGSGDINMDGQPHLLHKRSLSNVAGDEIVLSSSVIPGPVWPSTAQLKAGYAYAIRRDDGTFTQLIRADELGSIDISKVPSSQGPEGLIVLPPLKLGRPEQRDGEEHIALAVSGWCAP